MGKHILPIVLAAALLCLFVLPLGGLSDLNEEIDQCVDEIMTFVRDEDWNAAAEKCEAMYERFCRAKDALELYWNHEDIGEIEIAMRGSIQLTISHDSGQLLLELESIRTRIGYLCRKERFSIGNLI